MLKFLLRDDYANFISYIMSRRFYMDRQRYAVSLLEAIWKFNERAPSKKIIKLKQERRNQMISKFFKACKTEDGKLETSSFEVSLKNLCFLSFLCFACRCSVVCPSSVHVSLLHRTNPPQLLVQRSFVRVARPRT